MIKKKDRIIGKVIKRKDRCPLRIVERLTDGRYRARKVLPDLNHKILLDYFSKEEVREMIAGRVTVIKTPNYSSKIQLLKYHKNPLTRFGYWDITFPDDFTDLTIEEIEEMDVEFHSKVLPFDVACRIENGGLGLGSYSPRRG